HKRGRRKRRASMGEQPPAVAPSEGEWGRDARLPTTETRPGTRVEELCAGCRKVLPGREWRDARVALKTTIWHRLVAAAGPRPAGRDVPPDRLVARRLVAELPETGAFELRNRTGENIPVRGQDDPGAVAPGDAAVVRGPEGAIHSVTGYERGRGESDQ